MDNKRFKEYEIELLSDKDQVLGIDSGLDGRILVDLSTVSSLSERKEFDIMRADGPFTVIETHGNEYIVLSPYEQVKRDILAYRGNEAWEEFWSEAVGKEDINAQGEIVPRTERVLVNFTFQVTICEIDEDETRGFSGPLTGIATGPASSGDFLIVIAPYDEIKALILQSLPN